ncbi:MAG TPA: trigger factor [Lachnospiraceae bacterium]|nr:trigger factor [Lachnospiraceae bacterium]
MKKRLIAVMMTALFAAGCVTGCGSGTGAATEAATEATTEAASAEVALEEEWMNDPTAYMTGITASDYVDIPADYSALTVEVEPAREVTDEEVDSLIDGQLQTDRELREVTGRTIVREGDVVNIDYVGRINGEEFDGGSDENYDLEIGSGSFIAGFEEGLIDQKVGDTVTLELTFPEDYGDSTKAGVDAEFDVTINMIQEYVVPQLTDEYVTNLGITDEFGNVISTTDDFRTYVRNYLIESNESEYTQKLEAAIRNAIYEKSTFKKDPPAAMVERMNDSMTQELTAFAMQNYQVDLLTYMQIAYNSTEETYQQDIRDMAVEGVKKNIMLKAIGDKEQLSLTDDEFQAELEKAISNTEGYTSESDVSNDDIQSYRELLDKRKVMEFLKSKTTVVNPSQPEEGYTSYTAAPADAEVNQ